MPAIFSPTFHPCLSVTQQRFQLLEAKPHEEVVFARTLKHKAVHSSSSSSSVGGSVREDTLLLNDWPRLLQLSIGSWNLMLGLAVHAFLVKCGSQNGTFQGNNLVNMYSKLKKLDDAQRVFDEMPVRNTITWTSLMNGYSENGDSQSVFRIAHDMFCIEEKFNEHTCSVILQACDSPEDRILGEQVHGFAVKSGLEENVYVGASLVSMYSKGGCVGDAEKVFNGVQQKDIRFLNNMILEYGKAECVEKAISVFIQILSSGLEANDYTYTNIISACNSGDIRVGVGKQLHGLALKYGAVGESSVGNAVITMYGKYGIVEEVEKIFSTMDQKNLISWTALLTAYLNNGHVDKALKVIRETLDLSADYDPIFLSTMLEGCSECSNLKLGRQIHGSVIKLGYLTDLKIETALIDMYAKCRDLKSARWIFGGVSDKTIATFNAILVGFIELYRDDESDPMILFNQLRLTGLHPDFVTFSRLLSLSADQACLIRGKSLHAYAIKTGNEADLHVSNAVITMYAKCGSIEEAYQMFKDMNSHDSVSWNAIISAFALHGRGKETLSLFEDMKEEGFGPDEFTTLAILQACTYSRLWENGLCLFHEMETKYGIRPVIEHFACVVDLLGRAGQFSESIDFINKSPFQDSPLLWRILVNTCKLHGELDFGKLASTRLLDLEPKEAGSYILVSNMYAVGGMLNEAANVRTLMNDLKVSKEAGCSWIEIDDKVHYFVASDVDHPKSTEIYANLNLISAEMRKCGDGNELHLIEDLV
ncbi:pentatricopeptide repeat-containing protein At2g33680 [Ziziphus jujuba]|uniref:Pentatricopeptide repeat-containing protein At2g33680 n=1 Tax=Ziziphus jujuba TaxID=326968 RepID=A0A6P4BIR6_ZIZJJ|nr:pentatricopeptide repeat-containing protein At2g33680 [Ziziphus jujuba]